jgi:hypothetical protein
MWDQNCACCGLQKKDEHRTFNAQHRMLNVKTKQVFYWKFDIGRSMLNVHLFISDSCLLAFCIPFLRSYILLHCICILHHVSCFFLRASSCPSWFKFLILVISSCCLNPFYISAGKSTALSALIFSVGTKSFTGTFFSRCSGTVVFCFSVVVAFFSDRPDFCFSVVPGGPSRTIKTGAG